MRIGLLFNEAAGGSSRFAAMAKVVSARLAGHGILTCEGGFGGDYLAGAKVLRPAEPAAGCPPSALDHAGRIDRAVGSLADAGAKMLVCVGGDGFASYIAGCLIKRALVLPILGIAGGTANVGPLIGFTEAELEGLELGRCVERGVVALECRDGEALVGYAFNDVVVADTFLGSIGGRSANLSLEAFLSTGAKVEKRPSPFIAGPDFLVRKNGIAKESRLSEKRLVVAAPLNGSDYYKGKAIAGALCMAPWDGHDAVLAISDRNWIDTEAEAGVGQFSTLEHLLFGTGDHVEVTGLLKAGQLVVDGNAFFRKSERVGLRSRPDAVRVIVPEGK